MVAFDNEMQIWHRRRGRGVRHVAGEDAVQVRRLVRPDPTVKGNWEVGPRGGGDREAGSGPLPLLQQQDPPYPVPLLVSNGEDHGGDDGEVRKLAMRWTKEIDEGSRQIPFLCYRPLHVPPDLSPHNRHIATHRRRRGARPKDSAEAH